MHQIGHAQVLSYGFLGSKCTNDICQYFWNT
jgi:hypothetical protein